MLVVAFVPDLMDRSRFGGIDVTFVRSATDLGEQSAGADVAVADLGRPVALDALASSTAVRRLGYVNHENRAVFEAGAAAGIEVFARSRFFSRVGQIGTTG